MSIVRWTEAALADLESIRDHISTHSPRYALSMVGRIFARTEKLEMFPLFGAEVPEFQNPTLREVFEAPYRIVYRIEGELVDVVAVVHGARIMPRLDLPQ